MKKIFCLIVVLLFSVCFCSLATAATYDITGTWNYSTSGHYNNCGDSNDPESGTITCSQSGNTFTINHDGDIVSGTINGAIYTATSLYSEEGGTTTETLVITLSSSNSGTGTIQWVWNYGSDSCNGGSEISITKASSSSLPLYDITGTWNYSTSGHYNNCGDSNDPESGTITCSQSGNTFTINHDGDIVSGTINGAIYTATSLYSEEGGTTTETLVITLSSSNSGTGTIQWVWNYGSDSCNGGSEISITKASSSSLPYNITGTWTYTISGSYSDCGDPNDLNEPESGTVVFVQSGSTFTLTVNGDTFSGTINGAVYTAVDTYPDGEGTTTETSIITLSSATTGAGTIQWTWSDGSDSCSGGSDLSITKSSPAGGGGGGGCFLSTLY